LITNTNRSVISRYYYQPFGGRVLLEGSDITPRGYTYHEHLSNFGLINMNGRMYDPVLARFLSPDPYVQMPDFTQSFNRYAYCLNNPMKFIDPTGEKLKAWQWACIGLGIDALSGGAISSTALITAGTASSIAIGVAGFATTIPVTPGIISGTAFALGVSGFTVAGAVAGVAIGNGIANTTLAALGSTWGGNFGQRVGNAWKLSWGMFKTDKNLNFFQRYWQFMSRYTWEMPVTAFGQAWHGVANAFSPGEVNVGYFHGATVMQTNWMDKWGAVTVGSNITMGYNSGGIDENNTTLLHEYGHYLQTRKYGAIPWANMALSSITTPKGKPHMANWTEQDANYRSMRYFKNKITSEQYNIFLEKYGDYSKSYNYRFWYSYLFSIELISDFLWR
jgi:RHS repeat-associated protein